MVHKRIRTDQLTGDNWSKTDQLNMLYKYMETYKTNYDWLIGTYKTNYDWLIGTYKTNYDWLIGLYRTNNDRLIFYWEPTEPIPIGWSETTTESITIGWTFIGNLENQSRLVDQNLENQSRLVNRNL